jgi:glycerol-3-phosphate dehydrogenase
LAGQSTMPRPTMHSPADCLRLFPRLRTRGLRGGALYYDAATEDCRLTLAVLEAASLAGARLANHVELLGFDRDGVLLRDHVCGADVRLRARAIVNAAGPHVDAVRARLGVDAPALVRASRGSHLVLPPFDAGETSLAAFLGDGRIQFVVPHRRGVVCGTTEVEELADGAAPPVPAADVDYLLGALGQLLETPVARDAVRFAYCGWRALPAARGPAGAINREAFVVDEASAAGPLHTVVGGKLTTHRALAERAVNALLGRRDPSPSRTQPLPGGAGAREPHDPLWWRHGSQAAAVRELAAGDARLLAPFASSSDLLGVEIAHALRAQGAVRFADVMLRRLFQVDGPPLGAAEVDAAFELFARFRPAGLPPLDEVRERAEFAEQVRATTGALGIAPQPAAPAPV